MLMEWHAGSFLKFLIQVYLGHQRKSYKRCEYMKIIHDV